MDAVTALERAVLKAWEGTDMDYGYLSFSKVASRSGVARHRIRRVVRALSRKGVVQYGRGLWTDEGDLAGSGYGLTDLGRSLLATLKQESAR